MHTTISRRLVASTFAGGIVAAGVMLAAPVAQAAPSDCPTDPSYSLLGDSCDPGGNGNGGNGNGGGVVLGSEASAGGHQGSSAGNNRPGVVLGREASSGSSSSTGGLGATGADKTTELLGLLGLGLVGAGTASVVVNRRRLRTGLAS